METNSDVSKEQARVLHRVVRSMHDGQCPKCMHIDSDCFFKRYDIKEPGAAKFIGWMCPKCSFNISKAEADKALAAFKPYMQGCVEIFEQWRANQ